MDAISPVYLLLGAVICSMIGRFMLVRAAWEISKPWGIAVICVPLAPFFFRRNYKELAGEGAGWLRGAALFGLGFIALTGSTGSFDELWSIVPERFRPAEYAGYRSEDSDLIPDNAESDESAELEDVDAEIAPAPVTKLSPKATAEEKRNFFARVASMIKGEPSVLPQPAAAKPAAATVAAAPAMPVGPSLSERVAANQSEFARLSEVYERLKKEKGYLKKWDQDQIKTYNEQAAKYQADLAKARADQVELNKQIALVKK